MSSSRSQDHTWLPESVLPLWAHAAPEAVDSGVLHEPQLTVHLPDAALAKWLCGHCKSGRWLPHFGIRP
jgi:hypothetical protein